MFDFITRNIETRTGPSSSDLASLEYKVNEMRCELQEISWGVTRATDAFVQLALINSQILSILTDVYCPKTDLKEYAVKKATDKFGVTVVTTDDIASLEEYLNSLPEVLTP